MADIDFDNHGGIPRFSGDQARRLLNYAGAACSLALVGGLCVWGYNLAVRDVTGVPVIRAAEGPMRIAPSNPGGEIADHQGMAVNAVPELRASDALPEEIVLAPAPVELSVDDAPGIVALAALEAAEARPAPAPLTVPVSRYAVNDAVATAASLDPATLEGAGLITGPATSGTDDAIAMALAEALGSDPDFAGDVEALFTDAQPDLADDEIVVAQSIRPMPRPGRSLATDAGAATTSVSLPVANEIDPSTLAVGTRLVQLGAFDTPELARAEWGRLTERFGDLMSGKSIVIEDAQSGGRTFYRLRAHGFDGEDDSRRFCSALEAEDAPCVPVAQR